MKEKLLHIQQELKCKKGQYNSFGKYRYRSCEDILESVKPLLKEYKCILTINDELLVLGDNNAIHYEETYYDKDLKRENIRHVVVGGQRFYIKATATLTDIETGEMISNTALAREEENKKGMDGSQITGTSSSYARKYALNGLFAIDDTKDSDTSNKQKKLSEEEQELILIYMDKVNKMVQDTDTNYEELLAYFKVKSNSEMTLQQLKQAVAILEKKKNKNKEEVF